MGAVQERLARLMEPRVLVKITLGSFLAPFVVFLSFIPFILVFGELLESAIFAVYLLATVHALFLGPVWAIAAAVACWRTWRPGMWWLLLTPIGWFGALMLFSVQLI